MSTPTSAIITAKQIENHPTISFEPPGPGSWEVDLAHQSKSRGRLSNELFADGFTEGFRICFARYGMPLETLEARGVHGWMYTKAKPVGAPEGGSGGPPPAFVLKVLTRLLPELRRRNRTAKAAIAEKLWLKDAATWRDERGDWLAAGETLLEDQIEQLEEADLAAHVRAAVDMTCRMMQRHFELVGPSVATGRLLVAGTAWGLDPASTMNLLQGASPESAATVEPLRSIADLVDQTAEHPTSVAELVALSPEIERLTGDYLRRWGWQLLDDMESPSLMDNPDKLISLIDAARRSGSRSASDVDADRAALRAAVPVSEQARFDELVEEARRAYGVLDDHSGVTRWSMGIARRAILELARRAVSRGDLPELEDVWNLSTSELFRLADGSPIPDAAELEARAAARVAASEPPLILGDPPSPPPSAEVFPAPMRQIVEAFGAFMSAKFGHDSPQTPLHKAGELIIAGEVVASGHGVGTEPVTARTIVATDVADAMDRLMPGDILVCPVTTAGWNSVFPLLGGIITAHDGPVGHAAVMAREFDIPAIAGIGTIDSAWDGATATLKPRRSS